LRRITGIAQHYSVASRIAAITLYKSDDDDDDDDDYYYYYYYY